MNIPQIFLVTLLCLIIVFTFSSLHIRLEMVDGQLQEAWFVFLPGFQESYYPEHVVELKDWVGTGMKDIEIFDDGQKSPELEAGAALKGMGLYTDDYINRKVDGHWQLYRPEATKKYLTLEAPYRISPFKPANMSSVDSKR